MCSLRGRGTGFGRRGSVHESLLRDECGAGTRLARDHPVLPTAEPDRGVDRYAVGVLATVWRRSVELVSNGRRREAAEFSDLFFSGQLATDRAVHGNLLVD